MKKSHSVKLPKDDRMIIKIDTRELESKVRKTQAPPTQTHRDKTKYHRKPKHRKDENES